MSQNNDQYEIPPEREKRSHPSENLDRAEWERVQPARDDALYMDDTVQEDTEGEVSESPDYPVLDGEKQPSYGNEMESHTKPSDSYQNHPVGVSHTQFCCTPSLSHDIKDPSSSSQEAAVTMVRQEIKKQKRVFLKITSVFCVLSLLMGCAGGLAISSLANGEDANSTAQVYFNASSTTDTASESEPVNTSGSTSVAATAAGSSVKSLADIVAAIEDSVVAINVTGTATDYFNRAYPTEGSGSGVILSTDGVILTNNHVISGGKSITVFLNNGKSYPAIVLGSDKQTDLAVLKINASNLTAAKVGDSEKLRVGDTAIAIGNPLGELQGTVTAGIISALSRSINIDGFTLELMQTDTAINPGNSGGGLFNASGELIGIVTAKTAQTGIEGLGFVIPINNAIPIARELMTTGYVTGRPTIGLVTVDITDQRTAAMNRVSWLGVYVYETQSGSPSEQAGLQTADYIVSVDGKPVSRSEEVSAIIKKKSIGDTVTLVIRRSSGELTVTLKVAEERG